MSTHWFNKLGRVHLCFTVARESDWTRQTFLADQSQFLSLTILHVYVTHSLIFLEEHGRLRMRLYVWLALGYTVTTQQNTFGYIPLCAARNCGKLIIWCWLVTMSGFALLFASHTRNKMCSSSDDMYEVIIKLKKSIRVGICRIFPRILLMTCHKVRSKVW